MGKKEPLADRVLARLKNNRIAASLIVAGVVLGGVAGFTDSLRKLASLVPHREAHVDGEWHSVVFADSSLASPEPTQYYFQLHAQDATLYGTVRAVDPPDHPTGRVYGITDGKVDGNRLSWYIEGGWHDEGGAPEKEYFNGVLVSGDRIDFTYERYGGPAVVFAAHRVAAGRQ